MITLFDYNDFYNLLPVKHGIDEETLVEFYESLEDEIGDRSVMDYSDVCRLLDLVKRKEKRSDEHQ